MSEKIIEKLIELFSARGYKQTAIKAGIFLAVMLPIVAVVVIGYIGANNNLTELTLARRESIARLGAISLTEKFDRLADLGTSLATRVRFRMLVQEGKWDDAIAIMKDVPISFPYIDRIFLTDPAGTLMADTPVLPGAQGKNFAFRDWYKGVTNTDKPYISEIYKRSAEPRYNVIALAVPVKNEKQDTMGILVVQVRLDALVDWARNVDVGTGGFLYFVDKNGSVAARPDVSPQGQIVNALQESYVHDVLLGESKTFILARQDNRLERVISYAPVAAYRWGAIVEQPNPPAFALRDKNLDQRLAINGLILVILVLLMYFVVRFINVLNMFRQRERIFLESIGDGVIAIDRYWNITAWNSAASALSGWSKEETMGRPLRDVMTFVYEQDRKENILFIEDAIVRGKTGFMEGGTILIRKDKSEIPVSDSAAPVFDEQGVIVGAIIVFRDASQERDRQRLRSDVAYASHQLRTPVTKALWSLEAALDKKTLEEAQKEVGNAYQAMQSASRLSEELVEASRIDQKAIRVEKQTVKIADLLNAVMTTAQKTAKKNNVVVEYPVVLATAGINTDAKLCRRAIEEVIDNAIKYSDSGGVVKVSAGVRGDMFEVVIEDSGYGITEEERPLVFTKFFRGRNIDTTAIAGAGLGLYIAQAYVKLLGGKIWFEPKEKGTIFYISIPAF